MQRKVKSWEQISIVAWHIILKTAHIYYVTTSMGQESKSSFVRGFWLSISHEVSVKLSVRAAVIWGLMVEGSVSKLTPNGCWQTCSSPYGPLQRLPECPHNLAAGCLQSERSKKEKEPKTEPMSFVTSSQKWHTSHLPYSVGPIDCPCYNVKGDCTRIWKSGGRDPWGPSWRLAITAVI